MKNSRLFMDSAFLLIKPPSPLQAGTCTGTEGAADRGTFSVSRSAGCSLAGGLPDFDRNGYRLADIFFGTS
jgi:hypothetical protein